MEKNKQEHFGKSTCIARGMEKMILVLLHIYYWGFSTSDVIRRVAGIQATGYAGKLVDKGYLQAVKTASGVPKLYYTLTQLGLEMAEKHGGHYHYPEIDAYRVNQSQIRHYVIAQLATLTALEQGHAIRYETERMFHEGNQAGEKRPDVVWVRESDERIGVEVELTAKWDRKLDDFVVKIIRGIEGDVYARFLIISDSNALIERYKKALSAGTAVRVWSRDKAGHRPVVVKKIVVSEVVASSVRFVLIED